MSQESKAAQAVQAGEGNSAAIKQQQNQGQQTQKANNGQPIDLEKKIVDVWAHNFEQEMWRIMDLIQKYNYIGLDTEFPGVTQYPQQSVDEKDQEYLIIKENVRAQKIIQIGISLADEEGKAPEETSTWQFNFQFDEHEDKINIEAKELLIEAGIEFAKFKKYGINIQQFSEFFIGSDIVMNDDITWVAFHGGYDFGYIVQMLYGQFIPDSAEDFYSKVEVFFPKLYDLKYVIKNTPLKDYGLNKLASEIQVKRIGPQHQAGSDSLLTIDTFFKLRGSSILDDSAFINGQNIIYGIGKGFVRASYKKQVQNINQQQYFSHHQYPQQLYIDHGYHQTIDQYSHHQMHNPQNYMYNTQYHHQWMQMNQYQMMQDDVMTQQQTQNQQMYYQGGVKDAYGRKKNINY